jgi:hypothetical protein
MNLFRSYTQGCSEDNITRALIAVLSKSSAAVTDRFIKKFVPSCKIREDCFRYDLQKLDVEDATTLKGFKGYLLPISETTHSPEPWKHTRALKRAHEKERQRLAQQLREQSPNARSTLASLLGIQEDTLNDDDIALAYGVIVPDSRPDAWILSPHARTCIIIESKKHARFDSIQLTRHRDRLGKQLGNDVALARPHARWSEVYRFFQNELLSIRRDTADACRYPSRLLMEEFLQYLDICELSPFTGFRRYHFDIHDSPQESSYPCRHARIFCEQLQEAVEQAELAICPPVKKRESVPAWQFNLKQGVPANIALDFYGWPPDGPLQLCLWWIQKDHFRWLVKNADRVKTQLVGRPQIYVWLGLKIGSRNNERDLALCGEKEGEFSKHEMLGFLRLWDDVDMRIAVKGLSGKRRQKAVQDRLRSVEDYLRDCGILLNTDKANDFIKKIPEYRYDDYHLRPRAGLIRSYSLDELEALGGQGTVDRVLDDMGWMCTSMRQVMGG